MKKIICLVSIVISIVTVKVNAQNVGIGTPAPDASAQLDITAIKKGILIPRMTKADRNGIAAPANGLLVFQNAPDSVGFYYYNSGSWIWLQNASGAGSGWSTTGNTGTDTSVNFIGTNDNKPLRFKINNKKAGLISVDNLGLGHRSLEQLEYGENNFNNHTAIGNSALTNLKNGILNVGLGTYGLGLLVNGSRNIGLGFQSGSFAKGSDNLIIANASNLSINEFDSITSNIIIGNHTPTLDLVSDKNVLIGINAGGSYINGGSNVAVGDSASASNNTGASNVAIGAKALALNTTKNNLVAIGDSSLYNNGTGATASYEGTYNTAVGSKSLFGNTTGFSNSAFGTNALIDNTTGYANTAVGYAALNRNITGIGNTALGNQAMQGVVSGTAEFNVAVGSGSLFWIENGNKNTAIGTNSLQNTRNGSNNVAVGDSSSFKNTNGYSNVAIGAKALAKNTTKSNLVAIGDSALFNNAGLNAGMGVKNTAVGSKSLISNTNGFDNTALGSGSLVSNTAGAHNTGIGASVLPLSNGNGNVALGSWALNFLNTGNNNTAIGTFAGNGVEGSNNTLIAADSRTFLFARSISGAIFLGYEAGNNETTSNKLYIENSNADKNNALIYGDFAADSLNLNAKVNIKDFTRLGTQASGAPAIKMKKLVIPVGPAVDGLQSYPMGSGITDEKVIGVQIFVTYASPWKIPASYRDAAGYEFNYQVQANNIVIINKAGNSANIGAKPFTVLITYEE